MVCRTLNLYPKKVNAFIRGFTSVELLTVLLIAVVLTTAASSSFSDLIARQRTKSAASDLYIALTKARSEALKRNTNITISPTSFGDGWQAGWSILDANNNVLDSHGVISGVVITGAPSTVVYQSSGRILGNTPPAFLATATAVSSVQRCVSTNLSGRPYVKGSAC